MQPRFNSISAYEDEISKQQKAVDALHRQQFQLMLKNDAAGMDALDQPIKQAETDIDDLKLEMYEVMGAFVRGKRGNQLLEDDSQSYVNGMLHAYGNIGDGLIAEQERKDEAAQQGMQHAYGNVGVGLTVEQERKEAEDYKYITEKDFNTKLMELESQLGMREQLTSGYSLQLEKAVSSGDPNYLLYQHGYNRNWDEVDKLSGQIEALKEQRAQSEKADDYANKAYDTEEAAALAFADPAITQTGKDNVEMGAMIIHMDVPAVDANGNIVMQKKYVLGDMFKGNHADIIDGLASSYVDYVKMWGKDQMERQDIDLTGSVEDIGKSFASTIDTLVNDGITISFVHSHPHCTGHLPNEFSGDLGKTPGDVINYFAQGMEKSINDAINGGKISGADVFNPIGLMSDIADAINEGGKKGYFNDASHYIGDLQVPWLPGVERIYLASPISKELYAADINGPIMDPYDPSKYDVLGTFNSYIATEWQD